MIEEPLRLDRSPPAPEPTRVRPRFWMGAIWGVGMLFCWFHHKEWPWATASTAGSVGYVLGYCVPFVVIAEIIVGGQRFAQRKRKKQDRRVELTFE